MAEARMAVLPAPALQRVGFEVDTSVKHTQVSLSDAGMVLYIPHPRFLLKNVKRAFLRTMHKVQIAFMPLPMSLVTAIAVGVSVWVSRSPSASWQRSGALADLIWKLDNYNPLSKYIPTDYRVAYLAANTAAGITCVVTAAQRFFLRRLLSYTGWIYERAKKSLKTKVWGALLKHVFFRRLHNMLDAYQSALPTLPLPGIEATVSKYMESIEPLLRDTEPEEWHRMQTLASEFIRNEGPKLQRYLYLKWLTSDNYISDWWLNIVYLRGRTSLCINSNWYGVMYAEYFPTTHQSARAASMIYNLLKLKKQLDNGNFEPQILGGVVPLCMDQYDKIFSTTRIPGREQDTLVRYERSESKHIAVIHKGKFYRMQVLDPKTNKALTPVQLESAIISILNDPTEADPVEAKIPVLTAGERSHWADVREKHFVQHEFNHAGLEVFEKGVFVLCLDDIVPKSLAEEGKQYLCGTGINRWSDKSFCLCVTPNAKAGVHAEHSWGDAPTLAHILEWCSSSDEVKENFGPDGHVKSLPEDDEAAKNRQYRVFPPERVRFTVDAVLEEHLNNYEAAYKGQIEDLDLNVASFSKYGKGVCKAAKCSPDGWIQMAMQLAYYRSQGRFDQTYESSMTRLFKRGRTETIRSCTLDSCAFVKAMEDPSKTATERLELLRVACDHHQKTSYDAMTGKGVDRHLFGLAVVAYGKSIPSPFLRAVFDRKWKLSTSQVLTAQLPRDKHPSDVEPFHTPNGGFGPVADDGYGVSYCVFGEKRFYFNVSSKKSCGSTDSTKMLNAIFKALEDMGGLLEGVKSEKAPASPKKE